VNVVKDWSVGKITVESEEARNLLGTGPIDQFFQLIGVLMKRDILSDTLLLFLETAKFQRVMFAIGADVIGKQIIVSDFVPLVNMVPKPTDICNTANASNRQSRKDGRTVREEGKLGYARCEEPIH
jgi:hypothetical protein